MNNLLDYLKVLSSDIGQRGSTTQEELKAADYIQRVMKEKKVEVRVEKFKSLSSFSFNFALIYSSGVLASLVFLFRPLLSFLICWGGLLIFFAEVLTYQTLSLLLRSGLSQNVMGRILPQGEKKLKVVVVAHYDSSRAGLMFHPRQVRNFRLLFLLTVFSLVANTLLYTLALVFPLISTSFFLSSLPFVIYLLGNVLLLVHREIFFKPTPGANDNASGVAVMLSLLNYFSQNPLKNTELYFLATGSEEAGTLGMLYFLKREGKNFKDAYFINLDNLGIGEVKYIIKEGMLKVCSADPELIRIADLVSKEDSELEVLPFIFKTMSTDAFPALVRGFKAMSVMAFDKDGILPHWHWPTDLYENIEEKTLRRAEKFVLKMIERLERSKFQINKTTN